MGSERIYRQRTVFHETYWPANSGHVDDHTAETLCVEFLGEELGDGLFGAVIACRAAK